MGDSRQKRRDENNMSTEENDATENVPKEATSPPTTDGKASETSTPDTEKKPSSLGSLKTGGLGGGLSGGLNFETKPLGGGLNLTKNIGLGSKLGGKDKDKDKEKEGGDDEGDEDGEDNYEPSAVYTPVVTLPEVEVKTMEEEEEVLLSLRAKLYVYGENLLDKGTGKKGWNERGIGEIKLLKHRENERIRVLMRQEKTMKIVANHMIDPRYELVANAGSDKSWVYTCFDFSNGETLEEEVLAVRFSKADEARAFKEEFEKAKVVMKKLLFGEDDKEETEQESEETEVVNKALDSLTVSKKEGEEGEAK